MDSSFFPGDMTAAQIKFFSQEIWRVKINSIRVQMMEKQCSNLPNNPGNITLNVMRFSHVTLVRKWKRWMLKLRILIWTKFFFW